MSVLKPCPSTPNCVCSLDLDEQHHIEPFLYQDDAHIWAELKRVIAEFPRTQLITEKQDYLHYEFKTALFRFKDDVEIWNDRSHNTLHFRSASRIGRSDLGANRRRVEKIKGKLKSLSAVASELSS